MRILLFLSRKLPTAIGLAFMGGVVVSRQSWAWRSKATTTSMGHTPACKSSIISRNTRWRASAMDDATTGTNSEIQTAENQRHPLCKPFPVPTEAVDEVNFDWKSIASSVFNNGDSRPVVLFDGVCNLCNGAVNFSLDHDAKGTFLIFVTCLSSFPICISTFLIYTNIPPFLYYVFRFFYYTC